jgi:hypothetical protein
MTCYDMIGALLATDACELVVKLLLRLQEYFMLGLTVYDQGWAAGVFYRV